MLIQVVNMDENLGNQVLKRLILLLFNGSQEPNVGMQWFRHDKVVGEKVELQFGSQMNRRKIGYQAGVKGRQREQFLQCRGFLHVEERRPMRHILLSDWLWHDIGGNQIDAALRVGIPSRFESSDEITRARNQELGLCL